MKELKQYEVFFGENGLTSTSANHIANMAKESYQSIQKTLGSITYCSKYIKLLDSDNKEYISKCTTPSIIDAVPESIKEISKYKSLIAWLREAIKARTTMKSLIESVGVEDWCRMNNIEYPKFECIDTRITEEDYVSNLSVKDRNRYFELETLCSTLGGFIHEGGSLANAREEFTNRVNTPAEVSGSGRDVIITQYETSQYTADAIDKQFFELQNIHREYQSQLNSMKFECTRAVESSNIEYTDLFHKATLEHNQQMREVTNKWRIWKMGELNRINNLKIIIPNSLQGVYELINNK